MKHYMLVPDNDVAHWQFRLTIAGPRSELHAKREEYFGPPRHQDADVRRRAAGHPPHHDGVVTALDVDRCIQQRREQLLGRPDVGLVKVRVRVNGFGEVHKNCARADIEGIADIARGG